MRARISVSITSLRDPDGYQYRKVAASCSVINAVQVKPMEKPTESADSTQMASSFWFVPRLPSAVHSRVTGERFTLINRTVGIHLPSEGMRPVWFQRWATWTRLVATLRFSRYVTDWNLAWSPTEPSRGTRNAVSAVSTSAYSGVS